MFSPYKVCRARKYQGRAFSTNGNFSKVETGKNIHPLSLGMTRFLNRKGWDSLFTGVMQIINAKAEFNNVFNKSVQLPAISVTKAEK